MEKVAPLQRGFDLPTQNLVEGIYPVIYSNGILQHHDKYKCEAPGLITGRSGTIGKFTYIDSGFYWPHNTSLWVTDFCGNCPKFIYYLYQTVHIEQFSTGSGVPTLNRNDVHRYKTSVPTAIVEQEKIAKFLSILDERIVTQNKIIEDLKKLKSAIIERHYNQAEKQTVFIADLGKPFNVGNLSKDDLSETGKPCIIYGELFTTYGETISQVESHTNKKEGMTLSKKGDLLFPTSTTVDAISLIAPSVINIDGVILGGDMFGIHINPNYNAQYLSFYFNHIAKRQLAKYAKGSTIIHLHYTDIENAKLLLPSLEEQNRMAKCLVYLDAKINIENIFISLLKSQKTYFLYQMFI
ncbi:restriction endonuclease subunit S [Bacteroides fragilis]|uniref:restriction endonuclease subunit S n=1 Tax=Bacteroides fragilis TaxID=817 RepID=UPI001F4D9448|nr:restriction endonuclease subunit S [Bacteroides fragilis]